VSTTVRPSEHGGPGSDAPGGQSTGWRLGLLYGPAVFGVTAAGVALPAVIGELGVSPAAAGWVLTTHALALGVGTALAGRLCDCWGALRVLLSGGLMLGVGAAVCLAAAHLWVLVAGRLVLAAGSGAMTAVALTLAAGSAPAVRPAAMAAFGMVLSLFAASATLVGAVATAGSWRLAVVLPALSLFAVPACLRLAAARARTGGRVDVLGAGLFTMAVSALLLLAQGASANMPGWVLAGAGLLLVAATGWLARRAGRPDGFVPTRLLAHRAFAVAAAAGGAVYGGLFAVMYVVPQILTGRYGWAVAVVGAALMPGAVVGAVLSRIAGRMVDRAGGPRLVVAACAVFGLSLVVAAVGRSPLTVVVAASMSFAAFAVTQVVLTAAVSARIPIQQRGTGMGLLLMVYFVGGSLGVALAAAAAERFGPFTALGVAAALPLVGGVLALMIRSVSDGRPRWNARVADAVRPEPAPSR